MHVVLLFEIDSLPKVKCSVFVHLGLEAKTAFASIVYPKVDLRLLLSKEIRIHHAEGRVVIMKSMWMPELVNSHFVDVAHETLLHRDHTLLNLLNPIWLHGRDRGHL